MRVYTTNSTSRKWQLAIYGGHATYVSKLPIQGHSFLSIRVVVVIALGLTKYMLLLSNICVKLCKSMLTLSSRRVPRLARLSRAAGTDVGRLRREPKMTDEYIGLTGAQIFTKVIQQHNVKHIFGAELRTFKTSLADFPRHSPSAHSIWLISVSVIPPGYPGGAILPVFDAIYGVKDLDFILARHEQGAGVSTVHAC